MSLTREGAKAHVEKAMNRVPYAKRAAVRKAFEHHRLWSTYSH
jgi:hypothetical protein